MSRVPVCVNPMVVDEEKKVPDSMHHVEYARIDYINQVKPFGIDFEITSKCSGSCGFCYSSSNSVTDIVIPTEKVKETIDQAVDMGIQHISWVGGDALCHPDWYEIMSYAREKGIRNKLATSGILSKKDAQKIVALDVWKVGVHVSTINQEAYDKVHTNPRSLEARIRGYRHLLEAGYPAQRTYGIITISKPIVDTIEETVNWFVDEMGAEMVCFTQFKDEGFGMVHQDWEPTLTESKRIIEYRARKLGEHWLRIGASDGGALYCRSSIAILYTGEVTPCTMFRTDGVAGSIYQEPLGDIVERSRDMLLFNFKIEGYCGEECENRDICIGCRATALHYLKDVTASDPKCWLNPAARESYVGTPH